MEYKYLIPVLLILLFVLLPIEEAVKVIFYIIGIIICIIAILFIFDWMLDITGFLISIGRTILICYIVFYVLSYVLSWLRQAPHTILDSIAIQTIAPVLVSIVVFYLLGKK